MHINNQIALRNSILQKIQKSGLSSLLLPCLPMQERMWLSILILVVLTPTSTEGLYTDEEIRNIVVKHAMPFWSFAGTWKQYGVLLVLPANKRTYRNPDWIKLVPTPWIKNNRGECVYRPRIVSAGDVYVGLNYAVARPSDEGRLHTETQLLSRLPRILNNPIYRKYKGQKTDPPAVILYTRATPCTDCTNAIIHARNQHLNSVGQFIVAYTVNLRNNYMNFEIDCEKRNLFRNSCNPIQVLCMREEYNSLVGLYQCNEDDRIPCQLHNKFFGQLAA